MGVELILNNVRLSYPRLGEPDYFQGKRTKPNEQRRWDASFLIAKDGADFTAQHAAIMAKIKEVAVTKWKDKASALLKMILADRKACCYVDGETSGKDGYEGYMALTGHRKEGDGRMKVLDSDKTPLYQGNTLITPGRVYAGCYVNAKVEFFAYDGGGNKGIGCGLLVVQRKGDGASFGGASRPEDDDMEEITEGADAGDVGEADDDMT